MNDNNRRGAWDLPLPKYIYKKEIVVLIHDLSKETIEQEFKLDYGSYEDRKFLGRLTYYSITTGRSVETMSVEEWEKMNK